MSDIPHDETDKELEKLEKKINRTYKQSVKEMKQKVKDELDKYEKQNQKWKEWVDSGKKTQAEYEAWLRYKIADSEKMKNMLSVLEKDLTNSRNLAYSAINHHLPEVYAINANGSAYYIEYGINMDTSFSLYDRQTVERLIRDNPKILPKGNPPKNAQKWSQTKLRNELTQGILQGESNQNIAKRLERVFDMDRTSAIRNARTMTTSAECAGRLDSYRRAEKMGIELTKVWMATLDDRTRHEHRLLDGQRREIDEPFEVDGYELMYPADPAGEPYLVYNCRCTTISQVKGFEYDINDVRALGDGYASYDEWKHAKEKKEPFFGNQGNVPLPAEPIDVPSNIPPVEEWIGLCKQNSEQEMLSWEDRGFQGTLTNTDKDALRAYTGNAFEWMNGYLRIVSSGNDPNEMAKLEAYYGKITEARKTLIDETINALNKLKTERDIVVRRGTDLGDLAGLFMYEGTFDERLRELKEIYRDGGIEVLKDMFEGSIGEYGGFTSTSSLWGRGFDGNVEVILFIPEGTSASSIMRISRFGRSEGETLLNAGTPVMCHKIEQSDGHAGSRVRVFLEVLKGE